MKVSELLNEVSEEFKIRLLRQVQAKLDALAKQLAKELADDGMIENGDKPLFVTYADHATNKRPAGIVIVWRDMNMSDTVRETCEEGIVTFLKDEGYISGVYPANLTLNTSTPAGMRFEIHDIN